MTLENRNRELFGSNLDRETSFPEDSDGLPRTPEVSARTEVRSGQDRVVPES